MLTKPLRMQRKNALLHIYGVDYGPFDVVVSLWYRAWEDWVSTYTRERGRLTAVDVKRALAMVAGGKVPGRGIDHADIAFPGLILRTTPLAVTWYLKTRTKTLRLGDGASLTVAAAREAATRAKLDLNAGIDPSVDLRVFEHAMAKTGDLAVAIDAAFPEVVELQTDEDRRRRGPWQWKDLVDLYLAHKLPTLRPRWGKQFEGHVRRSLNNRLTNMRVAQVRQNDLLLLRDEVIEARTLSAAADTIEAVKSALDWALNMNSHRAGFAETAYPWWREKVQTGYESGKRTHTPRLDELARTLVLAEQYRALGGSGKETSDAVLGALWAVVLTGQRVGALTGTRRDSVLPWNDGPVGWKIWSWSGEEMKKSGGIEVPHALPMPPEALAMIAKYDADPTSTFLFPSGVSDKPLQGTALTSLFARLMGKEKAAKQDGITLRPEGDLFIKCKIRPWVRHDVRRALSTYLDMERLGGSASAILAHRRQRSSDDTSMAESEFTEAMTLKHYIHGQRLEVKQPGMDVWVKAILEAYETERARFSA
ncbi:integrase arm-type DNA-binding domain-containing protein [Methylobacterium sp. E-045]|uniref:integrase arm-type DNA-binding domain-containing protein n=1 Tax=Methylobacterium sp. E-045 TaxID=2836575 RepID=UPI001FB90B05|nr:integrase arm-type DNA-binding domain-containing protein [Methylobacterium sp. E-045]MCJ2130976.1 integrase arm-type DNA-binding domain-containing protein [Methylobacterium sp. E-045]